MKKILLPALLMTLFTLPAQAQTLTLSGDAKAVLEEIKSHWISIHEEVGSDLVSFLPLVGWRCGLQSVHYGFNGATPSTVFQMEPCSVGLGGGGYLLHVAAPAGSVDSVHVVLAYDDGTVSQSIIDRQTALTQ
ncbi:MAG: hypothetical protein ACJAQW_000209 [Paracoccaceae bacterium]|jgi:hypothetical protein